MTEPTTPTWPYPRWFAHRGAGKLAPENTMAAFRLGAQSGWKMFECDVKLSQDGIPFLLHDATLERTTNGQGIAGNLPWSALSQLDAGGWHSPQYAGETLPTLANVAQFCLANGYFLDLEIKPTPGTEAITGKVVAEHAARLWAKAATPPFLTSFQQDALAAAQQAAPHLPRGLLVDVWSDDCLEHAQRLQCAALVCNQNIWNAERIRTVKKLGMHCISYTVTTEEKLAELLALDAEHGIVSDCIGSWDAKARAE